MPDEDRLREIERQPRAADGAAGASACRWAGGALCYRDAWWLAPLTRRHFASLAWSLEPAPVGGGRWLA